MGRWFVASGCSTQGDAWGGGHSACCGGAFDLVEKGGRGIEVAAASTSGCVSCLACAVPCRLRRGEVWFCRAWLRLSH